MPSLKMGLLLWFLLTQGKGCSCKSNKLKEDPNILNTPYPIIIFFFELRPFRTLACHYLKD